jgi:NAD-dependent dihydropyrimidine dehydrogenase PreA subunit
MSQRIAISLSPASVPVTVDEDKCIAHKGCTVCVDVCPLDVLAIDVSKGKAYMKFDECWYCMPCEVLESRGVGKGEGHGALRS